MSNIRKRQTLEYQRGYADAKKIYERKKGRWIKISPSCIYECSVCHQDVLTPDIDVYEFCHHCGADMRGENNG